MSKKYRSKDEKIKQGAKIFAIVFAVIVVAAIIVGVVASSVTEAKKKDLLDLTDNMLTLYKEHPWNGGEKTPDYSEQFWEYYRLIMMADREASEQGYNGYSFDGDTVCVDLSNVPDADQAAVKEMMADYLTLRGKNYRFNSMEELDAEGLIDHDDNDRYTEGCILTFSELREQPEGYIEADIKFYYSQFSLKILNIGIFDEEEWSEHAAFKFDDQEMTVLSDDSVLYRQELIDGNTIDTFVLTAAEKRVYCISTMTG